jgi:acetate kinase
MTDSILVLNAGSSSIKFALYAAAALEPICRGEIEGIGGTVRLKLSKGPQGPGDAQFWSPPQTGTHDALTAWLIDALPRAYPETHVVAAGHRVVHGGRTYADPVVVNPRVLTGLEALIPLAPSHQPHNLAAIRAISRRWPDLPQVACFDTGFHRTQPRLAQLFGLPRRLAEEGVLRYGFHGLSYAYISGVLPEVAGHRARDRVIVAHLGHGASMCAMREGKSVATTMGFTALDGLVMGKRCGALDPGVVIHLLQEGAMSLDQLADLLNNRSGLLGVSGISDDVRELEKSSDPAAREALDLFAYRAAREIGSLAASLGGLDVLVFTAGIGEHSGMLRRQICEQSGWLGIRLDHVANARHGPRISSDGSSVDVFVVSTDEEIVIARSARALMQRSVVPAGTGLSDHAILPTALS